MKIRRMMMLGVLAAVSGCAGVGTEVLVGTKVSDKGFYGPTGPTVTLRLQRAVTERTWCEYEHVSHALAGRPFGDRTEEDALDQVSCGIRFGGEL